MSEPGVSFPSPGCRSASYSVNQSLSWGFRQVLMPAEILFAWRDWIRSILLVHASPHVHTFKRGANLQLRSHMRIE